MVDSKERSIKEFKSLSITEINNTMDYFFEDLKFDNEGKSTVLKGMVLRRTSGRREPFSIQLLTTGEYKWTSIVPD